MTAATANLPTMRTAFMRMMLSLFACFSGAAGRPAVVRIPALPQVTMPPGIRNSASPVLSAKSVGRRRSAVPRPIGAPEAMAVDTSRGSGLK